jgi:hypothetical protein
MDIPSLSFDGNISCSRNNTRLVKAYIKKNIFEIQDFDQYSLPLSCPIHPLSDAYYNQEKNYIRVSTREYQCLFCKKKFKSLFYMDRHMDNKHTDMLISSTNTFCLADLCQIFGCSTRDIKTHRNDFYNLKVCRKRELDHAKHACTQLFNKCYSPSRKGWEAYFHQSVCDQLYCEHGIVKAPVLAKESTVINWLLSVAMVGMILLALLGYGLYFGFQNPFRRWSRRRAHLE